MRPPHTLEVAIEDVGSKCRSLDPFSLPEEVGYHVANKPSFMQYTRLMLGDK